MGLRRPNPPVPTNPNRKCTPSALVALMYYWTRFYGRDPTPCGGLRRTAGLPSTVLLRLKGMGDGDFVKVVADPGSQPLATGGEN